MKDNSITVVSGTIYTVEVWHGYTYIDAVDQAEVEQTDIVGHYSTYKLAIDFCSNNRDFAGDKFTWHWCIREVRLDFDEFNSRNVELLRVEHITPELESCGYSGIPFEDVEDDDDDFDLSDEYLVEAKFSKIEELVGELRDLIAD